MATVPERMYLDAEAKAASVFIVDDDPDVRRTIALLVRSVDLVAEQFTTAREYLDFYDPTRPGCLVLDMRMPGMSGLELQKELTARDDAPPIVFISAHGEIPNATEALRAGAVDFISKPYSPQLLLERIFEAIAIDRKRRISRQNRAEITARTKTLTDRERNVMDYLILGESTKVIASRLNISPKTVDNHRAKILEKMGVDNPTQLARLVETGRTVE